MAVRSVAGDGMLGGGFAAQSAARTRRLTIVFDWPMQREHSMAAADPGKGGWQGELGHDERSTIGEVKVERNQARAGARESASDHAPDTCVSDETGVGEFGSGLDVELELARALPT